MTATSGDRAFQWITVNAGHVAGIRRYCVSELPNREASVHR